jgi:hypothetical protein
MNRIRLKFSPVQGSVEMIYCSVQMCTCACPTSERRKAHRIGSQFSQEEDHISDDIDFSNTQYVLHYQSSRENRSFVETLPSDGNLQQKMKCIRFFFILIQ